MFQYIDVSINRNRRRSIVLSHIVRERFPLKRGGPSAGSPTDTLLRLRPNQWFHLRTPPKAKGISGAPIFHDVTGGEYKTQERIHRNVADLRLLAIPAS